MMDAKGFGKQQSWPTEVLCPQLYGVTGKSMKASIILAGSGPYFEPSTSRIQVQSATARSTTLDYNRLCLFISSIQISHGLFFTCEFFSKTMRYELNTQRVYCVINTFSSFNNRIIFSTHNIHMQYSVTHLMKQRDNDQAVS
jgi:hypothetical protein